MDRQKYIDGQTKRYRWTDEKIQMDRQKDIDGQTKRYRWTDKKMQTYRQTEIQRYINQRHLERDR